VSTGDLGLRTKHVRLLGEPRDVSIARSFLRRCLDEGGIDGEGDNAVSVMSELVTNAVVHGLGPVDVEVVLCPDCVELHVSDSGRRLPSERFAQSEDEDGRGLGIVRTLSREFSIVATDTGNTVSAIVPLQRSLVPPQR
jgi:anti-sigma regulatory factor (Ser/Thr protein kinase)